LYGNREQQRENEQPNSVSNDVVRSKVVAITRGVSWPPATWIATSNDPNVNTIKDKVIVVTVWSMACPPEAVKRRICHPSMASSARRRRYNTNSRIIAPNGITHNALLVYRLERSQSRIIVRYPLPNE
jgi:hypothetical protein